MADGSFEMPPKQPFAENEELDKCLEVLSEAKARWPKKTVEERKRYLQAIADNFEEVYVDIARAASSAKGTGEEGVGEELQNVAVVANYISFLREVLDSNYNPKPSKVWEYNDHKIAQVYPVTMADKVLMMGLTAETWMMSGKPASQAAYWRAKEEGKAIKEELSCVLGAGNVTSIPPTDVLSKLFIEDEVVILKMNPVNDYITHYLQKLFAPLVEDGFVRIVTGGGDVGAYLTHHDKVDNVHITGSDKTHDLIVWGKDAEAQKTKGEPLLKKPITSELGCVTPVIVVPGPWSDSDMQYHARQIASAVVNNASCNCVAAKVLVTCKDWPLRDKFLDQVEKTLSSFPSRKVYYPGSMEKFEAYVSHYGDKAKKLTGAKEGQAPWTIVRDVAPKSGEYALVNEAWSGVLAEVAVPAKDASADEFFQNAEELVNNKIWGTLSATVLIHPKTEKKHKQEFEDFISNLRYGAIGVNVWSSLAYAFGTTVWGGHPGSTLKDVQSGIGVGHNLYMFDHAMKSVVRAPFRMWPTPVFFADHKNSFYVLVPNEGSPSLFPFVGSPVKAYKAYDRGTMKNFAGFKAHPSLGRFVKTLLNGLRG